MGAGVSAGDNNDDLVDNLKESEYIKTPVVERVFRLVDRGAYFLPDPVVNPYRDVAWKNGNFHISAPCIYSEVMEGLELKSGLSFLNFGSGTGYLNTLVGLILGSYGINHGIEIHEDVIHYAEQKVEQFKRHSGALDEFDFCEPKFIRGNCLNIAPGWRLYDRVYCGAACTDEHVDYFKSFINIGGILVVPVIDQLVQLKRISDSEWEKQLLLPVSFAHLVLPRHSDEPISLLEVQPLTLQELSRAAVRNILRSVISIEHPEIVDSTKPSNSNYCKKRKPLKRERRGTDGKVIKKTREERKQQLVDQLLITVGKNKHKQQKLEARRRETGEDGERSKELNLADLSSSDSDVDPIMHAVFMDILTSYRSSRIVLSSKEPTTSQETETLEESSEESNKPSTSSSSRIHETMNIEDSADDEEEEQEGRLNTDNHIQVMAIVEAEKEEKTDNNMEEEVEPCSSKNDEAKKPDRNKLDSGLGDEFVDLIESVTSSNDEEDDEEIEQKKCKKSARERRNFIRMDSEENTSETDSEEDEEKEEDAMTKMKMCTSPYSPHMEVKIRELPLPSILKSFLHYYREL